MSCVFASSNEVVKQVTNKLRIKGKFHDSSTRTLVSIHRVKLTSMLKILFRLSLYFNAILLPLSFLIGMPLTAPLAMLLNENIDSVIELNIFLFLMCSGLILAVNLWKKVRVYKGGISSPDPHDSETTWLAWGAMNHAQIERVYGVRHYAVYASIFKMMISCELVNKDNFVRNVIALAPAKNPFRLLLESELKTPIEPRTQKGIE